jgi:hypothetical protein
MTAIDRYTSRITSADVSAALAEMDDAIDSSNGDIGAEVYEYRAMLTALDERCRSIPGWTDDRVVLVRDDAHPDPSAPAVVFDGAAYWPVRL